MRSSQISTYLYKSLDPEDFRVIPQAGVRQCCFPRDSVFAACWDALLDPDGRVFVAAGAEASIGEYVKLCEYSFEENRFIERFYGRDLFLPPERAITASKLHFSMSVMEDGRIIGASHTTDRAPAHPVWMYKQYYDHIWDGFPGSVLFTYDPKTLHAENLGLMTPRETLYGGVYNPHDRGYYALGYIRGHLYRYSMETRRLTDFGKVTEWKTFRLHLGADGNIYGASKSGFLFMLDVETDRIVDLDFEISGHIPDPAQRRHSRSMAGTVNIPGTSKFLFSVFSANELYCHDTATHETTFMGPLRPTDRYCKGLQSRECVYAMALDAENVLWYALTCYPHSEMNGDLTFRRAASLMRWDLLQGKSPECLGVIGTTDRVNATVPSLLLDNARERMYIVDTNHGEDGMSLLAIDMKAFKPQMHQKGPPCKDSFMVKDHPRYLAMSNQAMENHLFNVENRLEYTPEGMCCVKLWRRCRPEESKVIGLVWEDDQTLCGVCGDNGTPLHAFRLSADGDILEFAPLAEMGSVERARLLERIEPRKAAAEPDLDLPHRNGRRYKAIPHVEAPWNHGRRIIGTLDGLLAVVNGTDVFALGAPAAHGPIHALTVDRDRTVCYGVAGDPEDLGMVFRYDDRAGLRQLGRIEDNTPGPYGMGASDALSSIVLNRAGDRLAVGSNDRLGMVYLAPP